MNELNHALLSYKEIGYVYFDLPKV